MDDDRDRIRKAVSIVDLVSAVTTVKKSGRNHMAVCPFHQEKTPSMSLDVVRGLYYCHGCHMKGDIFTFVQENEGLNFPEAMERLAGLAGITLTRDPAAEKRQGQKRALTEATAAAVDFYHQCLMKSPDGGHARAYLRSRGYDAETVADFKLGYAPHGDRWDHLVRELRARGIADSVMIDAGLARKGRKGGMYDLFRDRVMFPTFDIQGTPIGFGGRVLGDDTPKYLNTPETPLYKKSETMYGIDKARREIQKRGTAVIVEGYTDVIALHRNGLPIAVATNGTALGDDHFELLRRFTDTIVMAFDSDAAGGRAALRGDELEVPVRLDLDLRVARMPHGRDPADMVANGELDLLEKAIDTAVPLVQFRIEAELEGVDISEPEARARALKKLGPVLSKVNDDLAFTEYARFVADRLRIDIGAVFESVGKRRRSGGARTSAPIRRTSSRDPVGIKVERELLRSILADGHAARQIGLAEFVFEDPSIVAGFAAIRPQLENAEPGQSVEISEIGGEAGGLLMALAMEEAPAGAVAYLFARAKVLIIERRIQEVRTLLEQLPPDDQTSSPLMAELLALQDDRRKWEHRD
jgi:DNA primase